MRDPTVAPEDRARFLEHAILPGDPASRRGDHWISFKRVQKSIDVAGLDPTVVVEEKKVSATGELGGEIVPPREAGIHSAVHKDDVVAPLQRGESDAGESVGHHDGFGVDRRTAVGERIQASFDQAVI